jgi:hypothetical protein
MRYLSCFIWNDQTPLIRAIFDPSLGLVEQNRDLAISETLCDLVELAGSDVTIQQYQDFEQRMQASEAGQLIGDWEHSTGVNNYSIYFGEPIAPKGFVRIANDYSEFDFADGDNNDKGKDQTQIFTFNQLRFTIKTWKRFLVMIKTDGIEAWQGKRYEVEFPES